MGSSCTFRFLMRCYTSPHCGDESVPRRRCMDLDKQYVFQARTRVVFGRDAVQATGRELAALGAHHAFVVTDKGVVSAGLLEPVLAAVTAADITTTGFDTVEPNPSIRTVEVAEAQYRQAGVGAP